MRHVFIIAGLLACSHSSWAQTSSTTLPAVALPPTNVLLPNYGGVPAGETGSLEVGAFIARADDSSATFYNPAGLPRAQKTSVSGTAGMFQWSKVAPTELDAVATSFQQVPAMFGVALKEPLGIKGFAAGLSIVTTAAWRQGIDFERTGTLAGGISDRVSYSSEASNDAWLASAGGGFTAGARWRIGGTIDLQKTTLERRQALASQYRSSSALMALNINGRSEAFDTHLRFTVGTQYDVTSKVIVAGLIRTRGFGLFSSGLTTLEGLQVGETTTTASHFDDDVETTLKVPFEFRGGAAYFTTRAALEADVLVFTGTGRYESMVSNRPVVVQVAAGGSASTTEYAAISPVIDSRTIANVVVGGHLALRANGAWIVHGGIGTDRSPVGDADTTFTKVDLIKMTAGLSARTEHVIGSGGVRYITGESASLVIRNLPGGPLSSTFRVRNIGFVYSLTVLF